MSKKNGSAMEAIENEEVKSPAVEEVAEVKVAKVKKVKAPKVEGRGRGRPRKEGIEVFNATIEIIKGDGPIKKKAIAEKLKESFPKMEIPADKINSYISQYNKKAPANAKAVRVSGEGWKIG